MGEIQHIDHKHADIKSTDCNSMHEMFFHNDVCQILIFSGWITTNISEMLGACISVFIAGVLFEGIRKWRTNFFSKYENNSHNSRRHFITYMHAIQTCYHMMQVFMSYLLMLIFMTYNIWLCTSLVIGIGFGYLIFNRKKVSRE